MYECPNCNANLKFDIPTQKLLCGRCGTTMDPYAFQKARDAEEHTDIETVYTGEEQEYEVTVFTCPQCGGELISDDTTAATFCNFCGGATILDSRISREKRPKYIIPFKKTREDCEQAYVHMMRRAVFAPSELKKNAYISRFRSIYMPYWMYTAEKNERTTFGASEVRQSGDYRITTFYRLHSDVEAKYKGFLYDASSAFSDALSNAIAPYDWKEAREFAPAFLSGFYADAEDVPAKLYEEDVQAAVSDELCRHMEADETCRKFTLGEDMFDAMKPGEVAHDLAMFPVWFLSYRYKDRVSYLVVNGQTGKAAGNVPVDKKKYLMGSVLLALPLFILFNFLFSLDARTLVFLAGILGVVGVFMSLAQKKKMKAKEDYMDDKGSGRYIVIGKKRNPAADRFQVVDGMQAVGIVVVVALSSAIATFMPRMVAEGAGQIAALLGTMAVSFISKYKFNINGKFGGGMTAQEKVRLDGREMFETVRKPALGVLIAVLMLILQPRSELFFYGAALAILVLTGWNAMELIEQFNRLATRPIPQFGKRGGEVDGK